MTIIEWLPQLTASLGWLFVLSFLAATLLPLGSEWLLVTMLTQEYAPLSLWGVATVGNGLGSVINLLLGGWLAQHFLQNFDKPAWQRAQQWFQRFGIWSLLLAWVPVVGDPLTFIAGIFRVKVSFAIVLIFIGKALRYALLIAGYQVIT